MAPVSPALQAKPLPIPFRHQMSLRVAHPACPAQQERRMPLSPAKLPTYPGSPLQPKLFNDPPKPSSATKKVDLPHLRRGGNPELFSLRTQSLPRELTPAPLLPPKSGVPRPASPTGNSTRLVECLR